MDVRVVPRKVWVSKNRCFQIVVLEKTLESPFDSKEIKPVNPKGNQPWLLIRRTKAEAEAPVLWPPDSKSWLIGEDPDARKDWRQKEKAGRVRWLDSITNSMEMNFIWQTPGVSEQWETWHAAVYGVAESDMTEQLINSNKYVKNWQIIKLRFDRKQQTSLKQLSFNWKINLKRDGEIGEHKLNEMGALNMKKKKVLTNCLPKWLYHFAPHQQWEEFLLLSILTSYYY